MDEYLDNYMGVAKSYGQYMGFLLESININ